MVYNSLPMRNLYRRIGKEVMKWKGKERKEKRRTIQFWRYLVDSCLPFRKSFTFLFGVGVHSSRSFLTSI